MLSKIISLCGLVAVCQAGLLTAPAKYSDAGAVSSQNIFRHDQPSKIITYESSPAIVYHSAPAPEAHYTVKAEPYDAHPRYDYSYSVADDHTGDHKSQQESRDGDAVKGSYSFHEADGSVRTVIYKADDHSGFNAIVHNTAPTPAPVQIKTVAYVAAPAKYYH